MKSNIMGWVPWTDCEVRRVAGFQSYSTAWPSLCLDLPVQPKMTQETPSAFPAQSRGCAHLAFSALSLRLLLHSTSNSSLPLQPGEADNSF